MHDDIATAIDVVLDYHQRTKHHLNRYARALGYMDWENQPNPFRHYHSTSIIPLEHGDDALGPLYRELFEGHIPPERVDFASISQLFYYSMALSAWKQIPGGQAWSLRVNPSSGNLHPTESYLIIGQQCSSHIPSGLYHYLPYQHALEKRRAFDSVLWNLIEKQIPKDGFLVGLSSIYWRETWKYGERGFRYCHHDVGHAIGAFTIAAISLGWHVEIVDTITDDDASVFLGCDHQQGIEAEHVDCLIIVYPESKSSKPKRTRLCLDKDFMISLKNIPCIGKENRLSNLHHDWPIIEKVSSACRKKEGVDFCDQVKGVSRENSQSFFSKSEKTAFQIIRQRRSAVS
ncbi:MAG: SagB/ThcOx family dehydrogenase, partial [Nitrospiria bacterium]